MDAIAIIQNRSILFIVSFVYHNPMNLSSFKQLMMWSGIQVSHTVVFLSKSSQSILNVACSSMTLLWVAALVFVLSDNRACKAFLAYYHRSYAKVNAYSSICANYLTAIMRYCVILFCCFGAESTPWRIFSFHLLIFRLLTNFVCFTTSLFSR